MTLDMDLTFSCMVYCVVYCPLVTSVWLVSFPSWFTSRCVLYRCRKIIVVITMVLEILEIFVYCDTVR